MFGPSIATFFSVTFGVPSNWIKIIFPTSSLMLLEHGVISTVDPSGMVGGPVLAWVYKAVNTMDSMVGYKNETYLYFGRAAARLDDLVNYIPSRLSAVLMILASFFCRLDGKQAVKIYRRDRRKHASPNSAQTEAVCAGALGVQLAGDAWYFGVLHKKPVIGDDLRPVEPEDIPRANRLMFGTSVLGLLLAAAFQFFMSGFGR